MGKPEQNIGFLPRQYAGGMNNTRNLLLADAGEDGAMCPIGCASIYRASTFGHYLVADITADLSDSNKSSATLSEPIDPLSGSITGDSGPSTRVWGGILGPPPDVSGVYVFKSTLAGLSYKDLMAVDSALGKAIVDQGYDEAMYKTELVVWREESQRNACSAQVTETCKK